MRRTSVFILLGFLGLIYGQNFGGMQHGMVWTDNFSLDHMGSAPFIIVGGDSRSFASPALKQEPPTTPSPATTPSGSAGSAHGTDAQPEVDSTGGDGLKMLYLGFPLSISCNMTNLESTALQLQWFKNGIELENNDQLKIFQENSSIYIADPTRDDVGEYKCQTAEGIPGDDPLHKIINVIFLEIRSMDKSRVITEGEDLVLDCPVEGHPPPGIQWYKDAQLITDAVNETLLNFLPNAKAMPNGQLRLSSVQLEHRGNYSCTIISKEKKYERATFVRIKSVYAALWPFLGILVEMIVLGIIIFIFEKRRAKAEFDESDTDQGNDQKADNNRGQRRK